MMSVRSLLAVAACAAVVGPALPAFAADIAAPPAFALCGPAPATVAAETVTGGFGGWFRRSDRPRIVDVERFDPHHPAAVTPKYVIPQTAYLASSLCDYPEGTSPGSWYDGKLFYIPGGNRAAPDTFMVIERK